MNSMQVKPESRAACVNQYKNAPPSCRCIGHSRQSLVASSETVSITIAVFILTPEIAMAVNSPLPVAADLHPVPGIELGFAEAGVRKPNRKDLLVMRLAPGATVAGVFTQNRFCAAPVQLCKAHLGAGAAIRALLINLPRAGRADGLQRRADPAVLDRRDS
jgi:hypothetical protein